tara:strand:- start:5031 stop:5216 length:186 start_codon:yes stop_codon:yes gene_type:complete
MATATKTAATARKAPTQPGSSRGSSTQSRFATSKLIQNLGSSNNGIQFTFVSSLRTVHGRD